MQHQHPTRRVTGGHACDAVPGIVVRVPRFPWKSSAGDDFLRASLTAGVGTGRGTGTVGRNNHPFFLHVVLGDARTARGRNGGNQIGTAWHAVAGVHGGGFVHGPSIDPIQSVGDMKMLCGQCVTYVL